MMTLDRLEALIAAYGASPDRWPAAEREAGREALARHAAALAPQLGEASALDTQLASLPPVSPGPHLAARLLPPPAAPPRARRYRPNLGWLTSPGSPAIAAAMACLTLGITVGYISSPPDTSISEAEAFLITAFETEPLYTLLEDDI